MRRLICLLLILCLASVYAIAEIPDISGCTVDELYQLQAEINEQLGSKSGLRGFTAPIGTYEAGKDFPAGKYIITSPSYCTYITIYADKSSYNNAKATIRKTTLYQSSAESLVYDFAEGSIVEVGFSNARFDPFTGLVFD